MSHDKGLIFCHYAQVSLDWVLIETRTHTHSHRYGINQNLKAELTLHGKFQGTALPSRFLFPNCSSSTRREGSWAGCNPCLKGLGPNPPWNRKDGRGQTLTWLPEPCPAPTTSSRSPVLANIALPWQPLALKPFHPQDPPHSKNNSGGYLYTRPPSLCVHKLAPNEEGRTAVWNLRAKEQQTSSWAQGSCNQNKKGFARSCVLKLEVLSGAYSRETWWFPRSLVTMWKETNQL